MEGNITYWQLPNIDCSENPKFYTKSSQHAYNNYQPPRIEDFDSQDEEEGEEENPLPIPGPLGTHTRNAHSEHSSGEPYTESMRESLERHLRTIIEETFQPRTTPEWPP